MSDNSFGKARPSGSKWVDQAAGIRVNYIPKKGGGRRSVPILYCTRQDDAGPDGVECKLCGVSLQNLCSHLIHAHSMTPKEYRSQFGQDAPILSREMHAFSADLCRSNGATAHRANIGECVFCGKPFQKGYGARRTRDITCSERCRQAHMSKVRKGKNPAAATWSKNRLKYLERRREQAAERRKRNCIVCGKEYASAKMSHGEASRKSIVGVCSFVCRTEHRRRVRAA